MPVISTLFTPPTDYPRVKVVNSFEELVTTPLCDGVNALCWPRLLVGDFAEIVTKLGPGKGITTIDDERLLALPLSEAGQLARDFILQDLTQLREHELSPVLDCIDGYPHEEAEAGPMATHVQSFHADSATVEADTYLCTYHGLSSEGLRNDQAQRRVDIPEMRAELLRLHGGEDDEAFLDFLNEHYFDLHYAPLPQARPWIFGQGNLWRIACEYPDSPVPPCIHRAPDTIPGQLPRLLLIS